VEAQGRPAIFDTADEAIEAAARVRPEHGYA
jgi:hypothetical protein